MQLFSVTLEGVQQFADKYKLLKADDKVGFKAVEAAHKEIKKKRQAVTSRIKELVDPHQQEISKIKNVGNTILNILAPAEEHLEKERKDYEAEQDRLKQLEIKRKEELRQNRINLLRDNGCTFTGDVYAIGNEVIEAVSLAEIPEDIFSAVLGRVRAEKARIDEEKRVLELEARLRSERLHQLNKFEFFTTPETDLGKLSTDEYEAIRLKAEKTYNDRIAQAAEEHRRNQLRIDRTLELATYGGSTTEDLADIPDDEYAALIAEVKAEYDAFIAEKNRLKQEADNRVKLLAALEMVDAEKRLSEQAAEPVKEEEPMYLLIDEPTPPESIPVYFDTEPTDTCDMCVTAPVTPREIIEHTENAIIDSLASNSIAHPHLPHYDGSDLLSEQATKIIKEIVPVRMQQAIELLRKVMRDRGASAAIKNEIILFLNGENTELPQNG